MDRKIRIDFFPKDASRVRSIAFSRRWAIAGTAVVLPLCLLGFWLVFSGALREDSDRRFERLKLERETEALSEKTAQLQREVEILRKQLDSLESVRIRVSLSSGLETPLAQDPVDDIGRRFRLFGSTSDAPRSEDFDRTLEQARAAARFLDSSLHVLTRQAERTAELPTLRPVGPEAILTRGFGPARDPFTGRMNLHAGVDYSMPNGSPVFAAGGGVVIAAGSDHIWGNHVRIRHADRAETFYAHLHSINVSARARVERGQVIGTVGQSGHATGPRLHFEMRLNGEHVDPLLYLLPADAPQIL